MDHRITLTTQGREGAQHENKNKTFEITANYNSCLSQKNEEKQLSKMY